MYEQLVLLTSLAHVAGAAAFAQWNQHTAGSTRCEMSHWQDCCKPESRVTASLRPVSLTEPHVLKCSKDNSSTVLRTCSGWGFQGRTPCGTRLTYFPCAGAGNGTRTWPMSSQSNNSTATVASRSAVVSSTKPWLLQYWTPKQEGI